MLQNTQNVQNEKYISDWKQMLSNLKAGVHRRLRWVHNEVTQSEAEALWSAA